MDYPQLFETLPPGHHILAIGTPQTYHRIACQIEDAGFEIRDKILYLHERGSLQICLARKPLAGTVAANLLAYGVGGLNIDGCRVACSDKTPFPVEATSPDGAIATGLHHKPRGDDTAPTGRWPANIIHDGSDTVVNQFPNGSKSV